MPSPSPQPIALPEPHRVGGFGGGRFGRGRYGRGRRRGVTLQLGPLAIHLGGGSR